MDIFDILYPHWKFSKDYKIKMFECFSGIGCQKMALERVTDNFEIVGYSEIDSHAIKSYRAMHGDEIRNYGDISKIEGKELPEIDILTYSFPCFTKDTLVLTENGNKSISDVKVDELVLTHTNEYKKVLKVMNNGLKETIKINAIAID